MATEEATEKENGSKARAGKRERETTGGGQAQVLLFPAFFREPGWTALWFFCFFCGRRSVSHLRFAAKTNRKQKELQLAEPDSQKLNCPFTFCLSPFAILLFLFFAAKRADPVVLAELSTLFIFFCHCSLCSKCRKSSRKVTESQKSLFPENTGVPSLSDSRPLAAPAIFRIFFPTVPSPCCVSANLFRHQNCVLARAAERATV